MFPGVALGRRPQPLWNTGESMRKFRRFACGNRLENSKSADDVEEIPATARLLSPQATRLVRSCATKARGPPTRAPCRPIAPKSDDFGA